MLRSGLMPLMLLCAPCPAAAADLDFSGSLERVAHESISVRLADRRVIDARLPNKSPLTATAIAATYKRGDQVRIVCRKIQPVWEEESSRYQYLEVTKLERLKDSPLAALSRAQEVPQWREGVNLLKHPNAVPDAAPTADPRLEHAREVNLEYASKMPNFVADETAKRYTRGSASQPWRVVDTVETEITFKGASAVREKIRRDGKPSQRPFQALPGFKWYGGFGTEIRPLFDLNCPTSIKYEGRADVRGKHLWEYEFRSPADGCFGSFYFEYQRYNPARTGHVFLDDPGGNVIQLDEEAGDFPPEFDFAKRDEEVFWDYVKIGGASHLLPVGANFVILYSSGTQWKVEVTYKNHRHFESSTNVTFP